MAYVLLITASIMVVGTSALTLLAMGLKTTIHENKRLQSLYGAEAGIEWAQSLLTGTFQTATEYSEQQVKEEYHYHFDESKKEELNQAFKEAFKTFIEPGSKNEFVEALMSKKYYDTVDKSSIQEVAFSSENNELEPSFEVTLLEPDDEESYKIQLKSTFESVTSGMKNERQIQVVFNIKIPNFQGQYLDTSLDVYPVFYEKAMAIDGDLQISDSDVSLSGDLFVVGQEVDEMKLPAYDKYKGGITLTNSSLHSNDTIATAHTMNLISNSIVSKRDDAISSKEEGELSVLGPTLYARNLYLGSTDAANYHIINHQITGNKVTLEQATLDNDLAINSLNSTVTLNGFYGINDKNYEKLDVKPGSADVKTTSKTSSSIIINQKENTELNIQEEAYIMGVAYIDTDTKKYETGESIAVKGNYVAYTTPLEKFKDAEFNYYKPLYLVDGLSVLEKNDYFYEYAKQLAEANEQNGTITITEEKAPLKSGGVTLPDSEHVYTAGAIVHQVGDQLVVEKSNYKPSQDEVILDKQKEFAEQVYNMGRKQQDDQSLYEKANQLTVANSINFELLTERCQANQDVCQTEDLFIYLDQEPLNLREKLGDTFKGIILTNSDVLIDGEFTLNGTLMTTGTVKIEKPKGAKLNQVELNYDQAVVQTVLSQNYELFDGVFKGDSLADVDVNGFLDYDAKNYNPIKFIKSKNWKLVH